MIDHFRELCRHHDLLQVWTLREIKVRYKQSLLGGAWAILQPLALMVVFSVIFTMFIQIPTDGVPYPVFSYAALLPWTFFATSITFAVGTLTQNMNLVSKIYFPREILPVASVGAAFVDFLVASVVFVVMLLYYRIPLGVPMMLVPVLLSIQILLILGIVLFTSAVNVFYRDVRFVVPLGLQLWMYASPIIYPASLVPVQFRGFYMLNPMAALLDAYRATVLFGRYPDWSSVLAAAVVSAAVFVLGYLYFKRVERRFADII